MTPYWLTTGHTDYFGQELFVGDAVASIAGTAAGSIVTCLVCGKTPANIRVVRIEPRSYYTKGDYLTNITSTVDQLDHDNGKYHGSVKSPELVIKIPAELAETRYNPK